VLKAFDALGQPVPVNRVCLPGSAGVLPTDGCSPPSNSLPLGMACGEYPVDYSHGDIQISGSGTRSYARTSCAPYGQPGIPQSGSTTESYDWTTGSALGFAIATGGYDDCSVHVECQIGVRYIGTGSPAHVKVLVAVGNSTGFPSTGVPEPFEHGISSAPGGAIEIGPGSQTMDNSSIMYLDLPPGGGGVFLSFSGGASSSGGRPYVTDCSSPGASPYSAGIGFALYVQYA